MVLLCVYIFTIFKLVLFLIYRNRFFRRQQFLQHQNIVLLFRNIVIVYNIDNPSQRNYHHIETVPMYISIIHYYCF